VRLRLSQDPDADALISSDAFALLVGMVLDQQVPLEWAFSAPLELKRRLGSAFDVTRLAAMDPVRLASLFSAKPALHRYPGSMATRVHELARLVAERYGGNAADVWRGAATGAELFRRIRELPGFGEQKAKIFVALLGKQLGVRPPGWETVSAPFSDRDSTRSVADITGPDSLAQVRAFKADAKAAHKRAQAGAGRAQQTGPAKKSTAKAPRSASSAKATATKKAATSMKAAPSKKVATPKKAATSKKVEPKKALRSASEAPRSKTATGPAGATEARATAATRTGR